MYKEMKKYVRDQRPVGDKTKLSSWVVSLTLNILELIHCFIYSIFSPQESSLIHYYK